jgi:hypothetical protein
MDPGSTITKTIFGDPGHKFIDLQVDIPSEGTHTFTLKVTLKPTPHGVYANVPLGEATKAAMFGGRHKTKRTRRRRKRRKPRRRRKTKRRRRKRRRGGYRLRFPDSDPPTWELTDLPEYNKLTTREKSATFNRGDFHDIVAYLRQYGITSPVIQQYILNNLILLGITYLDAFPWIEINDLNQNFPNLDEENKARFINAINDSGDLPFFVPPS